jgi:hypothetical protein
MRIGKSSAARVSTATTALLVAAGAAAPVMAAQIRFDNGAGNNSWEVPANWVDDVLPGTADIADIGSNFTANVASPQTVLEVQVQWPNSSTTYVPGTATLNILPGADVQTTATPGVRIGRPVQAGQAVGSSTGVVNQTGGRLVVTTGTNGLRLSQADGTVVADSLYVISGGSVRGGLTNGSMTAPLNVGAATNSFNRAEFRVVGSGPTEIRFEDARFTPSTTGVGTGQTVLRFDLDAGGVTPIIAEDELRVTGTSNALLEINLIGLAPQQDITLITADRITGSTTPFQAFSNAPDGSQVMATFGGITYTWNVVYTDGSDDGILDASVVLDFVSAVPEPSSAMLLGAGALVLARRHRRR